MAAARLLLLAVFVLSLAAIGECGHRYFYELEQTLYCGGKPYDEATIVLFEKDPFFNDLCYVTNSTSEGTWHAKGSEDDKVGKPNEMQMHIRHRCQTGGKWFCYYRDLGRDLWTYNEADVHVWRLEPLELAEEAIEECYYKAAGVMNTGRVWESDKCA